MFGPRTKPSKGRVSAAARYPRTAPSHAERAQGLRTPRCGFSGQAATGPACPLVLDCSSWSLPRATARPTCHASAGRRGAGGQATRSCRPAGGGGPCPSRARPRTSPGRPADRALAAHPSCRDAPLARSFHPRGLLWPVKTSRGALAGFQPFARSPISPSSCRSLARTHRCLVPDPPWASRQELPRPPLAATCGLARWGSAPEPPGTQGQAPGLQAGDAHPAGLPLRVGPGQLRGRQLLAPPPVPLQTARRPAPAGCLPDRLSLCLSTGRRVLCHHSAPSGRRHFWIQRDRVCLRPLRYCGARRPEAGTGLRPAAAPEGRCLAPFPRRLSKVAAPPRSHSWWGQIGNPTPAYRCHPREARIPLGNFKLRETNTCKAKLPLSS